jgi:hypothetical protein
MRYGQRKAQERLLDLYRKEKLKRKMTEGTYCYYLNTKGMLKHLLGVNWVRLWSQQQCASWETLQSWSYEQDYKILRADGFTSVKNTITGKFRFTFVEMDRGTNKFDKIELYNKLYEQEKYSHWWWVPLARGFPTVQIVTLTPTRKRFIQEQIGAGNKNGLEFKVKLLDDVRREVMEKCFSPTCRPE